MRSPWVVALSAALLMQTVGTFVSQLIPVIAPVMTAELGLAPQAVGNFASVNTLGAILFLLFGTGFIASVGSARMLQWGAVIGAVALTLAATGLLWLLPAAALLMGIGYGPTGPAGSRILQATAPARHRVLIFSIKQAGAPAGGALAGLIAAPVAAAFGWRAAIAIGVAVAVLAALLLQLFRPALDADRERERLPGRWLTWRQLAAPLAALRMHPALPALTLQAFAFAALQGSLFSFTVTWLVTTGRATLTEAGTVFAAMQLAGVAGRLALGWAADRVGDARLSLAVHGVFAAALSALWVLAGPGASWGAALLLASSCGFTAASWNGIFLAEVARLSPPGRVAEASSGAIMLCFLGYLAAPTAFAAAVTFADSWTVPFLSACALLGLISVGLLARRIAA